MSSPAPEPNTATTTTNSSAPATPTTSTSHTKKPAALKAVTGFSKLSPNDLLNQARGVVMGLSGNTDCRHPEKRGQRVISIEMLSVPRSSRFSDIRLYQASQSLCELI